MLLRGRRLIDLSRLVPGPYASWLLASLGMEVVKIEDPRQGDYLKWIPPMRGDVGEAYTRLNHGKEVIPLDLKDPSDREQLLRLISSADALLEGFRPGTMARLGLDWEVLKARNPRLVMLSLSGYGQNGPLRDRAGHDLNYLALAGLLNPNAPPPETQIADFNGGTLAALGIVSGILHADRTGTGCYIDLSMLDGLAPLGLFQQTGQHLLSGGAATYAIYPTADSRAMALAALEPKFWQGFCQAVNRPDLLAYSPDDPVLSDALRSLFVEKTQAEWVVLFSDRDVCCEPVLTMEEAQESAHARSRVGYGVGEAGDRLFSVNPPSPLFLRGEFCSSP